jgi:hypothetical protein
MKKLKLLPRWMRLLGLFLVIPCIVLFFLDPEIVFAEGSYFKEAESPWKTYVPSLLDQSSAGEGEFVLYSWVENDLSNEFLLTLMLVGTYCIAFAKIKDEDEFSYQLRMESMTKSTIINGVLLLIASWLFYDALYLYVLIWGLFSYLLIFSIVFALKIRSYRKALVNEE